MTEPLNKVLLTLFAVNVQGLQSKFTVSRSWITSLTSANGEQAIVYFREKGRVDQVLRSWQSQSCPQYGTLNSAQLEVHSFAGLW